MPQPNPISVIIFTVALIFTSTFATDQSTLLSFKSQFTTLGRSDVISSNWSATTPTCSWVGVSCDANRRRVTGLNLSSMGLTGTIPPYIGNLTLLTSLDLSYNNFYGAIPPSINQCRELRYLSLANNEFDGSIPAEFGDLTLLRELHLGNNHLERVFGIERRNGGGVRRMVGAAEGEEGEGCGGLGKGNGFPNSSVASVEASMDGDGDQIVKMEMEMEMELMCITLFDDESGEGAVNRRWRKEMRATGRGGGRVEKEVARWRLWKGRDERLKGGMKFSK